MQQETIERIRGGDLDAYEAVVRQYQGILLGYAAHRLPDINAAQDVVQLTFIRAFEQLDEYEPRTGLRRLAVCDLQALHS